MAGLGGHGHDDGTPRKSLITQRWEEQVEKAFLRPSVDWILRMEARMHA